MQPEMIDHNKNFLLDRLHTVSSCAVFHRVDENVRPGVRKLAPVDHITELERTGCTDLHVHRHMFAKLLMCRLTFVCLSHLHGFAGS